jgi:uncharacterized OB-fold protein
MFQSPETHSLDLSPLESTISLPYRLTPGKGTGSFLAELRTQRILATRCPKCQRVEVPAQDVCSCGHDELEFVRLAPTGTVVSFTTTPTFTLGLIRLDGADCDLLHRLVDNSAGASWQVGQRVTAVWSATPTGEMMDLSGFRADQASSTASVERPATASDVEEAIDSFATSLTLHYQHARGPYYGRLFDEMKTSGRILGIRCPKCQSTLLPPRELCDVCYTKTGTWVDVSDEGVLLAFSIIHLKFVGQFKEPPYIYAEVMLDGASTKVIHVLDGVDLDTAPKWLKPGVKVKAVWKSTLRGSLNDISHFELVPPKD